MKKNKLFVILSILISISLFATAALCNLCTAGNLDEPKTDVEEDTGAGEEAVEEGSDGEEASQAEEEAEEEEEEEAQEEESTEEEETTGEEEETQDTLEEPTIELEIYEGPLYSQADDICYWRVKAIITGVPTPVVEFSRDDSNGAWGSRKAQINIANPTDSYNLTATVTNSEGVDTDSISLSWGCNRPPEILEITFMGDHFTGIEYTFSAAATDPDGNTLAYSWTVEGGSILDSTTNPILWTMPGTAGDYDITVVVDDGNGGTATVTETVEVTAMLGPPIAAMDVPIVSGEGGYISKNGTLFYVGHGHNVGDSSTNEAIISFISFDISGLGGAAIETAEFSCHRIEEIGDPSGFTPLWVSSVSWEPGPIIPADFNLSGDPIQSFSTPNFTCTASKLKLYLQNAINSGRDRFQIMMFFTGMATDNDNLSDYWPYIDSEISLYITYTP